MPQLRGIAVNTFDTFKANARAVVGGTPPNRLVMAPPGSNMDLHLDALLLVDQGFLTPIDGGDPLTGATANRRHEGLRFA